MTEWEADDLVELRVRGEFVDLVGLLSTVTVAVVEEENHEMLTPVANDLADQANQQINFGLAKKHLKRIERGEQEHSYRGIDVRVHEFNPRHPDESSELDVDNLPPFEEANSYAVVMQTDEGMHMAGYPDELETDDALQLASGLRMYARDVENELNERALEET